MHLFCEVVSVLSFQARLTIALMIARLFLERRLKMYITSVQEWINNSLLQCSLLWIKVSESDIIKMLDYIITNIFVTLRWCVFISQSAFLWVSAVHLLVTACFFIHMRQTSYRGFSGKKEISYSVAVSLSSLADIGMIFFHFTN